MRGMAAQFQKKGRDEPSIRYKKDFPSASFNYDLSSFLYLRILHYSLNDPRRWILLTSASSAPLSDSVRDDFCNSQAVVCITFIILLVQYNSELDD
jgi:hypothetical protein